MAGGNKHAAKNVELDAENLTGNAVEGPLRSKSRPTKDVGNRTALSRTRFLRTIAYRINSQRLFLHHRALCLPFHSRLMVQPRCSQQYMFNLKAT